MAMMYSIRSVLGDAREAEVHEGAGYPWITCPFCGSAVYLGEPSPDHAGRNFVARDGRCNNPWCLANPAMPLDAARQARGRAILSEMDETKRRADAAWSKEYRAANAEANWAARESLRASAVEAGACVACADYHFRMAGRRKLIKHRGPCPRSKV